MSNLCGACRLCVFFIITASMALGAAGQQGTSSFVSDAAQLLEKAQVAELGDLLANHNGKGIGQIWLVVVPQLPPEVSLENYARAKLQERLASDTNRTDVVLLVISMKERALRIETSEALGEVLPDAFCKQVIDDGIVPLFRRGQFYEGIRSGLDALVGRLKSLRNEQETRNSAIWIAFDSLCPLLAESGHSPRNSPRCSI